MAAVNIEMHLILAKNMRHSFTAVLRLARGIEIARVPASAFEHRSCAFHSWRERLGGHDIRKLLLAVFFALSSVRAFTAEPFPSEGWWEDTIPQLAHKVMDSWHLFHLERCSNLVPLPGQDPRTISQGIADPITELRQHPKEAWLLTFYVIRTHVNKSEVVQVSRTLIPARISGDSLTVFEYGSASRYQIKNTENGTELHFKDGATTFRWGKADAVPVKLVPVSREKREAMKKRMMVFFP